MIKCICVILVLLSGCANKKFVSSSKINKESLELIEVVSQVSAGGAADSKSSKRYTFLLKKLVKDTVVIDSVWIDQYVLKLQYQMPFRKTYGEDTLALSANVYDVQQNMQAKWPVITDKKGVLRFYINGKPEYIEVDSIRNLRPVMYPGIKPAGEKE